MGRKRSREEQEGEGEDEVPVPTPDALLAPEGRGRAPGEKGQRTLFEDDSGDEEEFSDHEDDERSTEEAGDMQDEEDQDQSLESLPGWMKHGQVLENWKEVPISQLSVWLKEHMKTRLHAALPPAPDRKSTTLFPVQSAVLPGVIRGVQQVQDLCPLYTPGEVIEVPVHRQPIALGAGDALVCAPTGSGKTLAYVLPLVQALESRVIPHTRALVLLPSRDLALQVFQVFQSLIDRSPQQSRPLRVVKCLGKSSFVEEHRSLQEPYLCDIVIATPGRLIDHLTAGFSLRHLQYLIIDEADRLLMQSYQDWVLRILTAARHEVSSGLHPQETNRGEKSVSSLDELPAGYEAPFTLHPSVPSCAPLRKYLFSATLTRNPAKIANLQLQNPLYFHAAASGRFIIPERLQEFRMVCRSAGEKPLALMQLLEENNLMQTLCFTKSVTATHRLFVLLKLMGMGQVFEFSSTLSQTLRSEIIEQFRNGQVKLLICSDAMARGMDIDDVATVINYDTPPYIKSYVHRVGRTARAGKKGKCFTLLEEEEVELFTDMRKKADEPKRVQEAAVNYDLIAERASDYSKALQKLQKTLQAEKKKKKVSSRGPPRKQRKVNDTTSAE